MSLFRSCAVLALGLTALGLSHAQTQQMVTRWGTLSVDSHLLLHFNGKLVRPAIQGNSSLSIKQSFRMGSEDVHLVENVGGSACPALLNWVVVSRDTVQSFATFGTCSDVYQASRSGASLVVQMRDAEGVEHRYVFADRALTDNGRKVERPMGGDFGYEAVIEDPDGFTNVRAQANGRSAIVARVEAGTVFQTHVQSGDWWRVKVNGRTGFMHQSRVVMLQGRF